MKKNLQICLLLATVTLLPLAVQAEEPVRSKTPAYRPAAVNTQQSLKMGPDGTLYAVRYDLNRGREYWQSPYRNHPNHKIRYVYVINRQGQRLKPDLYVELPNGRLALAQAVRSKIPT
jgi:hypothetical protein